MVKRFVLLSTKYRGCRQTPLGANSKTRAGRGRGCGCDDGGCGEEEEQEPPRGLRPPSCTKRNDSVEEGRREESFLVMRVVSMAIFIFCRGGFLTNVASRVPF